MSSSFQRPFNFSAWIREHQHLLTPPVANRQLFESGDDMVVMIVGGPNQRVDFHDDPVEEFFYQITGDMILKIADRGKIEDVLIKEGDVFLLPPHIRHSPQRPQTGSVGLVVEGNRHAGQQDGFEWFCFECGELVHRVELVIRDIVADLPPLFNAFYESESSRTCSQCGALHPGKEPPANWVQM
jgi:3-hydroxyanthranilate 3,4-dioxygenase